MIDLFESEPDWSKYNASLFEDLYSGQNRHVPSGFLTQDLMFNHKPVLTPLRY